MAAYVKYYPFVAGLADGQVDFLGGTHTFKAIIHTDGTAQTASAVASCSQIPGTNGYTTGGTALTYTSNPLTAILTTTAAGVAFAPSTDIVWTASGGALGGVATGRYFSIYDDTPTTPVADPLMCQFDYGGTFNVATGETMTLDFDTSLFTLA